VVYPQPTSARCLLAEQGGRDLAVV